MDDAGSRPILPQGRAADLFAGPQEMSPGERRALAEAAATWLRAEFGDGLVAVALYGSVAVGQDGPYSEVSVWAAVEDGAGGGAPLEWVWGPGKLAIDVKSVSQVITEAVEVTPRWPLTHGRYVHARPLWEAPSQSGFVARVAAAAADLPDPPRQKAMGGCLLALYGLLGKLRNTRLGPPADVPRLAAEFGIAASCLVALHHRHALATDRRLYGEAFQLAGPGPEAFKNLLRRLANGVLLPPADVMKDLETFWQSLPPWLEEIGFDAGAVVRPFTPDLEIP